MLEAIEMIEHMAGRKLNWRYVDEARKGDRVCYISDLRKFKKHFPNCLVTRNLETIVSEMVRSEKARMGAAPKLARRTNWDRRPPCILYDVLSWRHAQKPA